MSGNKRSANFSPKEESLLVCLVKENKNTLENKTSDTRSNLKKAECWLKIETAFNSSSGEIYRSKEVLRKKYENIKKRVKQKYSAEKCFVRGTGGGPSQEFKFTNIDSEIKEMLGTRIEGNESEFGGDAVQPTDTNLLTAPTPNISDMTFENHLPSETVLNEDVLIERETLTEVDYPERSCADDSGSINDWTKYTPEMLRSKKSEALRPIKKKDKSKENVAVSARVSQWAMAKSLMEESKQRFLEEEHKTKLQLMKDRHEEEMKILRENVELDRKMKLEEHKVKMEILELQKRFTIRN